MNGLDGEAESSIFTGKDMEEVKNREAASTAKEKAT